MKIHDYTKHRGITCNSRGKATGLSLTITHEPLVKFNSTLYKTIGCGGMGVTLYESNREKLSTLHPGFKKERLHYTIGMQFYTSPLRLRMKAWHIRPLSTCIDKADGRTNYD